MTGQATDPLEGYRGDVGGEPQPVEDHAGAPAEVPAPEHESRAVPEAIPAAPEGERRIDPRQALAEKFKRDRADRRAQTVPASFVPAVDGDNPDIPGAIPADPEDPDAAVTAAEEAASRAATIEARGALTQIPPERAPVREAQVAQPGPAAQPYQLTVDGNRFTVSRDDLLRYAEVDPSEAEDYSDVALVRLAQKQIAASMRLDQARRAREDARRETELTGGRPAADQTRTAPQPQPQPVQPDEDLVKAIEEVQYGDPRQAAAKVQTIVKHAIETQIGSYDAGRKEARINGEYAQAINDFQASRPDIVNNSHLSSMHVGLIAREIANDMRSLGVIDDRQYAIIANSPDYAAKVQRAALTDGYNIRRPAEILAAASAGLDQALGRANPPVPVPTLQPASPAPARVAQKRALLPQPARSGFNQTALAGNSPPATVDRNAHNKAVLESMRKARHQTV